MSSVNLKEIKRQLQEEAARMMGLNVDKEKVLVYTISGFCSGFAGMLLASRLGSGQPYAAAGWELNAIAAVVIGGTLLTGGVGNVINTIFGGFFIYFIHIRKKIKVLAYCHILIKRCCLRK